MNLATLHLTLEPLLHINNTHKYTNCDSTLFKTGHYMSKRKPYPRG